MSVTQSDISAKGKASALKEMTLADLNLPIPEFLKDFKLEEQIHSCDDEPSSVRGNVVHQAVKYGYYDYAIAIIRTAAEKNKKGFDVNLHINLIPAIVDLYGENGDPNILFILKELINSGLKFDSKLCQGLTIFDFVCIRFLPYKEGDLFRQGKLSDFSISELLPIANLLFPNQVARIILKTMYLKREPVTYSNDRMAMIISVDRLSKEIIGYNHGSSLCLPIPILNIVLGYISEPGIIGNVSNCGFHFHDQYLHFCRFIVEKDEELENNERKQRLERETRARVLDTQMRLLALEEQVSQIKQELSEQGDFVKKALTQQVETLNQLTMMFRAFMKGDVVPGTREDVIPGAKEDLVPGEIIPGEVVPGTKIIDKQKYKSGARI